MLLQGSHTRTHVVGHRAREVGDSVLVQQVLPALQVFNLHSFRCSLTLLHSSHVHPV